MDQFAIFLLPLIAALIMAYFIRRKMQSDERQLNRLIDFSEEGIRALDDEILQFQGKGRQSTRSFLLAAGRYKLRYRFPENQSIKVELLDDVDEDDETLLIKSGTGEIEFAVENGRYLLDIEPQDDEADWKIEITALR